jgi:NAD(P)-dependent dehydrogenase (short-subunit alcohol dehydrogenase family)
MTAPPGAVLITGASSGIGLACSRLLALRGFRVFAASRTFSAQQESEEPRTDQIVPIALDVTSDHSIADAIAKVRSELSTAPLAGLVNCAGGSLPGPLEHIDRAALNRLFDLNVTGQLALIRAALPMLRSSRGRIVNVGSTSGRIPGALNGAYSASKAALETLTSVLRAELARSGIRVSMIVPGVVATAFWDKVAASEAALTGKLEEAGVLSYGRALARRQALFAKLRSSGRPAEDVCNAILHALCSPNPQRRYVVGADARLKLAVWAVLPERIRDHLLEGSIDR